MGKRTTAGKGQGAGTRFDSSAHPLYAVATITTFAPRTGDDAATQSRLHAYDVDDDDDDNGGVHLLSCSFDHLLYWIVVLPLPMLSHDKCLYLPAFSLVVFFALPPTPTHHTHIFSSHATYTYTVSL